MYGVYFGNAAKQTWIKAPSTGMSASSQGWNSETQLLNGQTFIKRSQASHRRFEMSWLGSMNDSDITKSLNTIKDYSDGIYGEGPFYWNDPFAMESNLFSPAWSAPAISIDSDWYAICPDDVGIQKSKVTTASISDLVGNNTQNYPLEAAKYQAPGNPTAQSDVFSFYIPEGYTLWLGLHGHHGGTGAVFGKPYNRAGTEGTPVQITPLGVNTPNRVNTSFSGSTTSRVDFYLAKISAGPCTFHVVGLIAQLLKNGVSPEAGEFVSGRGTTGLEFVSAAQIEYYSAKINNGQIGMSVTLAEV